MSQLKSYPPNYHSAKIAWDTLKRPLYAFMGGPTAEEAVEVLVRLGFDPRKISKVFEDGQASLK